MNKELTKKEVIALANEIIEAYNDTSPKWVKEEAATFSKAVYETKERYCYKNLDEYELVVEEGGEGEGDDAYHVIQWKGQYYKFKYSYSSYDGFDYDYATVIRVEPKEKTIVVYE